MHIFGRDKTVQLLQIGRAIRSIGQGIAVVDLTLYLKSLSWSAPAIGGVLTGAAVIGSILMLGIGYASDRVGRKPFLITYESLICLSALLMTVTANPLLLTTIILFTGFGRGQNGAAGPFTPAEQAWMVDHIPPQRRSQVLSINSAIGFFGMALGALIAGLPHLWQFEFPGSLRFRPLFLLIALFSAITVAIILAIPSDRREPLPALNTVRKEEHNARQTENRNLTKLAFVNILNGLAIGFFGPMMAYWFSARFHASSLAIGTTLSLSLLIAGLSSLFAGHLATRLGMVKSVVMLQLIGVGLIVLLPFSPTFTIASILYILRSAFSRSTQGSRSALSTSLTRNQRRGFAISINSLSMRMASAIGPTVAGYLLSENLFGVPFFLAGGLQLASTLLYGMLFRDFDRHPYPQETRPPMDR